MQGFDMTKGIQVHLLYETGGPFFRLHINGQSIILNLGEVDVLSDLLRLKVDEAIRHYEKMLNKTR